MIKANKNSPTKIVVVDRKHSWVVNGKKFIKNFANGEIVEIKKKRKNYPTKLRPTIFKQTHKEYILMKRMAKKETKGNLSLLIRTKVLGKRKS